MVTKRCIACGAERQSNDLLKFTALATGEFALDLKQTLPLNGAYVCADKNCIKTAVDRRFFDKFFGIKINPVSADWVFKHVNDVIERYIYMLLRNGLGGAKVLSSAMLKDTNIVSRTKYILISQDVGNDNKSRILSLCGRYGIKYCFFKTKADFYNNVEGKYRAAYCVQEELLAKKIEGTVDKLRQINNGLV